MLTRLCSLGSISAVLTLALNLSAQQQVVPPVITGTASSGVGFVTSSQDTNGITAQIGRFDTPFPNGLNGPPAPGLEPSGASIFTIDIDVNDGALATFSYKLLTYDAGIFDFYDISLQTPTGTINLVNHLGRPGRDFGVLFETPQVALSMDLNRWRNQHVQFIFSVQQDGYGDQTQGQVIGFGLRNCQVPPLTPLTDPAAIAFENGQTLDTADLVPNMQTALDCVQTAVTTAGGTLSVNSAFRPPAYQEHLRQVWDEWRLLRDRTEPECAFLRTQVQNEFNRHGLLLTQRPATGNGAHTQGLAVDMRSSLQENVFLQLANQCGLFRPFPANDPVHFLHQ